MVQLDDYRVGIDARNNRIRKVGKAVLPTDGLSFGLPQYTTAELDALETKEAGMIAFSTTDNSLVYYDGSTWAATGSSGTWTDAEGTWTFASLDDPTGVITVPSDATDTYSAGMRISFVNGGSTIYGIITVVTSTTITFLHEIDPTDSQAKTLIANSAITSPKFSGLKAPLDFPLDPKKWTVEFKLSTEASQSSPAVDTWYHLGSSTLNVPIGVWDLGFETYAESEPDGVICSFKVALSTSSSTISDTELSETFIGTSAGRVLRIFKRNKIVTLTAKDDYYLIILTTEASGTSLGLIGDDIATTIRAVCSYL